MVGCRLPLAYTYIMKISSGESLLQLPKNCSSGCYCQPGFKITEWGEQPDIREVGNRLLSLLPRFNNYDENAVISLQEAEAIQSNRLPSPAPTPPSVFAGSGLIVPSLNVAISFPSASSYPSVILLASCLWKMEHSSLAVTRTHCGRA